MGSWKRQIQSDADTCRHGHFQKAFLHLYNSYFSYLTLFVQQHSLPDPGVDLVIARIHIYTTLAWAFKGAARCLTRILPGKYQDIARAISWESGLPMTLIPSQFKESMRFDSLY